MTDSHGPSDSKNAEKDLSDALASLSLTTELDSALLGHLNLLDKYMFHVECLSQLFRLVFPITTLYLFRHSLSWLKRIEPNRHPEANELENQATIRECKLRGECRSSESLG